MSAPDAGRPAVSVEEVLADPILEALEALGIEDAEMSDARVIADNVAAALADAGIGPIAEARAAALEEAADELRSHRLDLPHRPGAWLPEDEGYNAGIDHCVGFLTDRIESAQRPEGGA